MQMKTVLLHASVSILFLEVRVILKLVCSLIIREFILLLHMYVSMGKKNKQVFFALFFRKMSLNHTVLSCSLLQFVLFMWALFLDFSGFTT